MHIQHIENPVRVIRRTARISCQVVRLSDFRLIADEILDLSAEGLRVGPADPVFTGEPVIISFRAPGFRDYIDAEAIVARVVHGRRPGETRRDLGLQLVDLDRHSRRLLASFAKCLPPAPPGHRPGVFRGMLREAS